jgi:hypothetical protein
MPFSKVREWQCFDTDTGKDSAREVREYFIPDFSNWKAADSYQEALRRLVKNLKTDKSVPKHWSNHLPGRRKRRA